MTIVVEQPAVRELTIDEARKIVSECTLKYFDFICPEVSQEIVKSLANLGTIRVVENKDNATK